MRGEATVAGLNGAALPEATSLRVVSSEAVPLGGDEPASLTRRSAVCALLQTRVTPG